MQAVSITKKELGDLLICSVRYAVGRMTYIVDDVCNLIFAHYRECLEKDQAVLLSDLERELRLAREKGKLIGNEFTHKQWEEAHRFMHGVFISEKN
jgi:hypothetical protein